MKSEGMCNGIQDDVIYKGFDFDPETLPQIQILTDKVKE
jgi:hypothetical protein